MPPNDDIDASLLTPIAGSAGTLGQRVYASLREGILAMALKPGEVLRKEAICAQLGVSRSPVSEAIARLSAEGLVTVVPQSATRVSCLSLDEIREGAFIREALELAAVEKVARDRSDDQLAQLTRNLRLQSLLVEDHDFPGFYAADEEFHRLITEFTGFPRLGQVAELVTLQVSRARRLLLPTPGRAADTVAEHRAVVEAIRDRDPEAARRAMRRHLAQLIKRIEPLERDRPDLFAVA